MRKQTHSKKRKTAAPKRKVAKKSQRNIRGGGKERAAAGAIVVLPIIERGTVIQQGAVFLPGNAGTTPDVVFPPRRKA